MAARAQRAHQLAATRSVARVHDHREVSALLQHGHRGEVEGVSVRRLEGANAVLAEDHVAVALYEDVLGGQHQVIHGGGRTALEEHRPPGPPELGEERVVVHVAGADLDHVGHPEHGVELAHVGELGDHRQAGLRPGLTQDNEAGPPQALEAARAGARLEGAATQHRGAGGGHAFGRGERLLAGLDGAWPCDQGEAGLPHSGRRDAHGTSRAAGSRGAIHISTYRTRTRATPFSAFRHTERLSDVAVT